MAGVARRRARSRKPVVERRGRGRDGAMEDGQHVDRLRAAEGHARQCGSDRAHGKILKMARAAFIGLMIAALATPADARFTWPFWARSVHHRYHSRAVQAPDCVAINEAVKALDPNRLES